ncbi:glycosyltransferase [Anaerobacillus sp. CMMVII]|uniref:glycosyltransferase n=1 Tax=Anaerobacillus sp. CMMVII TaxID=2755588 RepID=UPI0037C00A68
MSTSNNEYSQHLGVMLNSLLENTKNREILNIYIIDGGISSDNKYRLNKVTGRFKKKLLFLRQMRNY